jgi:hypothetical protein
MDEEQVRQLVMDRRIGPEDLAWREGMAEWAPVRMIPDLLPRAAGPYAQPSAAAAAAAFAPVGGAFGQQSPAPYAPPAVPFLPAAPAGSVAREAYGVPVVAIGPGPTLNYATPAGLAPMPLVRPTLRDDQGPFLHVGRAFHTGRARWNGTAIVSPHAFYLLKRSQHQTYYGGGILGALIAAAMTSADDTRTCYLGELPPAVRAQFDPKGKRLDRDVIVLPREAVRLLKPGAINSVFNVHAGYDKVVVYASLFRKGKIKRFLAENGWYLNQEVIPSAPPIHGFGFGRYPGGPGPRSGGMSGAAVALLVLGVLLIIAIGIATASGR